MIPAGLCSLFSISNVCPRPVAVTSHYVLTLVTIRGRDHPRNSGCWLIIATRNPQFTSPLPLGHWFSFLWLHKKKDLEKDERGLVYISHKENVSKMWGQTQGVSGCQRYWNILKFCYCFWWRDKGGCLHLLSQFVLCCCSSLQQPWGAKCLEREQSSQELFWAPTLSCTAKPSKSQLPACL